MFLNLKLRLKKNIFLRSVFALSAGSFLAQLLNFLFQPFITRIYTPEDMGVFSSVLAIVAIWTVISSGRYELAILLPDDDKESKAVAYLCFIIALCVSAVIFIWYIIKYLFNIYDSIGLFNNYIFLCISPLVLLGTADLVITRIAIRRKKIRVMAITHITLQLGDKLTKIILGFFYSNPISLIIGTFIGQAIRVCSLFYFSALSFFKTTEKVYKSDIVYAAKRYKKFPLIDIWGSLLDIASSQLPIILLASLFSKEAAGNYGLSARVLSLPMMIIGKSISNVFCEKAARTKDNKLVLQQITINLFKKLIFLGAIGMSFVVMYGDILFPFVFGAKWYDAGIYASYKATSLIFVLAFSPLSSLFTVYERISESFFLMLFSFIISVLSLFVPYFLGMTALNAVIALSLINILMNSILCIRVLRLVDISYLKVVNMILYILVPVYLVQIGIAFFIRSLF